MNLVQFIKRNYPSLSTDDRAFLTVWIVNNYLLDDVQYTSELYDIVNEAMDSLKMDY